VKSCTGCEKNVGVVESDLTHALAGREVPFRRFVDPTQRRHHVLIARRVSSDSIEACRSKQPITVLSTHSQSGQHANIRRQ